MIPYVGTSVKVRAYVSPESTHVRTTSCLRVDMLTCKRVYVLTCLHVDT